MATFTMELREVAKYHDIRKLALGEGAPGYPIFDEGYRIGLNNKIIDHYWMQEIGQETPDLFLFYLRRKMREIMPYYNQMYESTAIKFDPLSTMDIHTISTNSNEATTEMSATETGETSGNTSAKSVNSQFPQTLLNENGDYADSGVKSDSDTHGNSSSNSDQNVNTTGSGRGETLMGGRQGSGARLIMEYRAALLNVDMMVIDELKGLFMGLWQAGDHMTGEPPLFPLYNIGYYNGSY